jgi:hypothetical protein
MSTLLNHLTKNIMSPDELIIDNGEFAGNILVHTLFKIGKTNTLFNLPQSGGDNSSSSSSSSSYLHDTFKGLSVPIGILHFNPPDSLLEPLPDEPVRRRRSDSSSSDSSDSSSSSSSSDSSSDEEVMKGQDKKIKTRGVVNDELFDRFIMLAQELNSRKQQRKSRKTRPDKSVRKSKKRV